MIGISDAVDTGLSSTGFGATFLGATVIPIASWVGEMVAGLD